MAAVLDKNCHLKYDNAIKTQPLQDLCLDPCGCLKGCFAINQNARDLLFIYENMFPCNHEVSSVFLTPLKV